MEIVEIYEGFIWSVKYEGEKDDIFSSLMKHWLDIEYLNKYFENHKHFIERNEFWDGYTIEELVLATRKEAISFLKNFKDYYWNSRNGKHPDLEDNFLPLEKYPSDNEAENRRKIYGKYFSDPPSLLRLYALRIESKGRPPGYIVTGGGIKLTGKMSDMKELSDEIKKLISVQNWLKQKGINCTQELFLLKNGKR